MAKQKEKNINLQNLKIRHELLKKLISSYNHQEEDSTTGTDEEGSTTGTGTSIQFVDFISPSTQSEDYSVIKVKLKEHESQHKRNVEQKVAKDKTSKENHKLIQQDHGHTAGRSSVYEKSDYVSHPVLKESAQFSMSIDSNVTVSPEHLNHDANAANQDQRESLENQYKLRYQPQPSPSPSYSPKFRPHS